MRRCGVSGKRMEVLGLILIVVGALAVVVGRISYTTQRDLITIGPYQTPLETRRVIPLRGLGTLAIVGGALLIVARKRF